MVGIADGENKQSLQDSARNFHKEQMKLELFEYIEILYNRKWRHSALNYATI